MKIEQYEAVELLFSPEAIELFQEWIPLSKTSAIKDTDAWRRWVNEKIEMQSNSTSQIALCSKEEACRANHDMQILGSAFVNLEKYEFSDFIKNKDSPELLQKTLWFELFGAIVFSLGKV